MAKADQGLRVNFSDQEAASEAFSFEPIPSSSYHAKITEIEERESKSDKNFGKPYWAVTLVIQEGQHADRRLWANVMLFDGALFSLAQLLKATDHADALESGKIPDPEVFITKDVVINVAKVKDTYKMNQEDSDEILFKNEVKGFKPLPKDGLKGSPAKGSSLLP